jgi:hypothetical protein
VRETHRPPAVATWCVSRTLRRLWNCRRSVTIDAMCQANVHPTAPAEGRSPFAEQLCVPQFGILHILILTAITAALLKFNAAVEIALLRGIDSEFYRWWIMTTHSIGAVVLAAGLVGSGVLWRVKCWSVVRRLQPGHWIVLIGTLDSTLWWLVWRPVFLLLVPHHQMMLSAYLLSLTVLGLPVAAAFIYATIRLNDARSWKILLGSKAVGEGAAALTAGLSLLFQLAFHTENARYSIVTVIDNATIFWSALCLVALLVAVVLDIARRASRDWLHWLGVATLVMNYLLLLGWWAMSFSLRAL